jgi:prevent-host-death family protein
MAKETILSFVEARANLSEIVDNVSEHGQTYVISKRDKPVAVIVGMKRYNEMTAAGKHLKNFQGKRILKLRGIATAVGDMDQAIKNLRKSRIESLTRSL